MVNPKTLTTATLALILTGTLVGCATDKSAADSKITRNLQSRLDRQAYLGPPNTITVQTLDHVVYLNGEVSAGLMRETAADIARNTPGVKEVVNRIFVSK
jgi:osmotically-inducible protein OsmY